MNPQRVAEVRRQLLEFASRAAAVKKPKMLKASMPKGSDEPAVATPGVVLPYKPAAARQRQFRPALKMPRQRTAVAAAR
jgi:hypothetical protein